MRKNLLILLVLCSFGVFTAWAQDNSSGASQNNAQPSYTQPGASGQQSGMQMANGANQTADGCLVKEQTSYYIQPVSGGARTQLSPSRSLDAYVGQDIRVTGHNDNASGDSSAVSSGSASPMGSSQSGLLTVTGIHVVSASCAPGGGMTSKPQ